MSENFELFALVDSSVRGNRTELYRRTTAISPAEGVIQGGIVFHDGQPAYVQGIDPHGILDCQTGIR